MRNRRYKRPKAKHSLRAKSSQTETSAPIRCQCKFGRNRKIKRHRTKSTLVIWSFLGQEQPWPRQKQGMADCCSRTPNAIMFGGISFWGGGGGGGGLFWVLCQFVGSISCFRRGAKVLPRLAAGVCFLAQPVNGFLVRRQKWPNPHRPCFWLWPAGP